MSLSSRATELLDSISRGVHNLITVAVITEADSSPYTVVLSGITGLKIWNWNSSNIITFTLTFADDSTMVIPIQTSSSYEGAYGKTIKTIAYAGTAADFSANLMKRYI